MLRTIVAVFRRKLLGNSFFSLHQQVSDLKRKVVVLETALRESLPGSSQFWLYDNAEERMDAQSSIFDKERRDFHLARYEFCERFVRGMKVGDIACGTGYGSGILSEYGAGSVIGIDISEDAVSYAKERYGSKNVDFIVASADSTELESESLDVLVSFETIEHLPENVDLLTEFYRLLKPSGVLIISTPNDWPLTAHHLRRYNYSTFRNELRSYFQIEQFYNQNSGTGSIYNHNCKKGIIPTSSSNKNLAECYIAVCRKIQ